MKTEKKPNTPIVSNNYTAQFKEQALERTHKDGIPKMPQDLVEWRYNLGKFPLRPSTGRTVLII